MSHRAIALGLAIVVVVTAGVALWAAIEGQVYAGRVFPGVTIEGQDVGGLDAQALTNRVKAMASLVLARPVVIRAGPNEFSRTAAALGTRASVDRVVAAALAVGRTGSLSSRLWHRITLIKHPVEISIIYTVDVDVARSAVTQLIASIVTEPIEAEVTVTAGRLVVTRPSRDGVVVDESSAVNLVMAGLMRGDQTIGLVVALRRPALSTEGAQRMAEPVASFSTRFPYNPDRIHNIRLAAAS
ncbi:MAG: peptidoglycan binding domain-containing protein, partial [Solimonas sp.]